MKELINVTRIKVYHKTSWFNLHIHVFLEQNLTCNYFLELRINLKSLVKSLNEGGRLGRLRNAKLVK